MPKLKNHSGAKKRFRKSACGKYKHRKAGLRHLLTGMPAKRGRKLRKAGVIEADSAEGKTLKKYLPYK